MSRAALLGVISLVAAAHLGCRGEPASVGADAGARPSPGASPIRRLTRFEYDNTVRDLLGDDTRPAQGFTPEEVALGFDNQAASLGVTQLLAEQYAAAAERVTARALARPAALLPCDPAVTGEEACARRFIATFGARAFRRPLEDEENERLHRVYLGARRSGGFLSGIGAVMEVALQSPRFLYRVELASGAGAGRRGVERLDGYALASRLSYLLWASMPDDELFAAAAAGRLATAGEVAAQARRMLEDPRARAAVARFHAEWLGLDQLDALTKDRAIFPAYRDGLRPLWKEETLAFLDRVVFDEHGDLGMMLTAPWSVMNEELAASYGVEGEVMGAAFERVELDPAQRAGLLTHAGILAVYAKPNQSSPVHRGKFVREKLLCQALPSPPPGIMVTAPKVDRRATTRSKFLAHSADPFCAGCHQLMDGIGLGFEHYDGVGAYRATDHGFPVDARGAVLETRDANGPFNGVPELARRLARSAEVRDCVVLQWFRYANGRGETKEDAGALEELGRAFAAGGFRIEALVAALAQSETLLYREVGR